MQEHLFIHFSSRGRNGFLNDVSITFIGYFRVVNSGLNCSPVDLMLDVIKSLPSFLIYCCYCSYLFLLWLSIVSMDKPVY